MDLLGEKLNAIHSATKLGIPWFPAATHPLPACFADCRKTRGL